MDAFFAAIEQRDDPGLRGRPVAVGGGGPRGVVAAASYEARAFGVRSAMPGRVAARACPDLIFVRPRMQVYQQTGLAVRAIFSRFTELVEPLSIDEAYLDVTAHTVAERTTATGIARAIKAAVNGELGLTVSAGVSNCKFVAKIASGWQKPDGLTVVPPDEVPRFVAALPIAEFYGVGPATAAKLRHIGVQVGADLLAIGEAELVRQLGKFGARLHQLGLGIDERPVQPNRDSKSIGAERTFDADISDPVALAAALEGILESLTRRLARAGSPHWRTLTLKVRTDDFRTATRSKTFPSLQVTDAELVRETMLRLLNTPAPTRPVRLLGLTVSNFAEAENGIDQLMLPLDSLKLHAQVPAPSAMPTPAGRNGSPE